MKKDTTVPLNLQDEEGKDKAKVETCACVPVKGIITTVRPKPKDKPC